VRSGRHVPKLNDKFKVVVKLLTFLQLSFLSHPAHISLFPLCPPMVVPPSDISLFVDGHLGRKGLLRANLRESLVRNGSNDLDRSQMHISRQVVHCRAMQCVAVRCGVLQFVAVCCIVLFGLRKMCNARVAVCSTTTLQYTATHCNILQHAATLSNTL